MATKVESLSGGERARLLINLIALEAPHLILLDEPTNHLDIDSRHALLDALTDYEGAVVLVTHDRALMEMVADRLWLTGDGTVTPFDGDMEDTTPSWCSTAPAPRPGRRPPSPPRRSRRADPRPPDR